MRNIVSTLNIISEVRHCKLYYCKYYEHCYHFSIVSIVLLYTVSIVSIVTLYQL